MWLPLRPDTTLWFAITGEPMTDTSGWDVGEPLFVEDPSSDPGRQLDVGFIDTEHVAFDAVQVRDVLR